MTRLPKRLGHFEGTIFYGFAWISTWKGIVLPSRALGESYHDILISLTCAHECNFASDICLKHEREWLSAIRRSAQARTSRITIALMLKVTMKKQINNKRSGSIWLAGCAVAVEGGGRDKPLLVSAK